MLKRKNKNNSFDDKIELELLNKYYIVDRENKIITMPLHYEKASDLIDNRVISKDNYLFDYSELASINDRIKRIPIIYSVNIDIQIDDYEEYNPKKLLDGFNDALELNSYNYGRERRKKWLQSAILLVIGLTILFFMAYGKINSWFGDGNRGKVFSEAFDIFGWVFIWECVTVAFLTPSELGVSSPLFKYRVKKISFSNSKGDILSSEETAVIYNEWTNERKWAIFLRWALLISGTSLIVLDIIRTLEFVGELNLFDPNSVKSLFTDPNTKATLIIYIIFYSIQFLVLLGAGILNLSLYRRKNIHKVASYCFSVLLFFVVIIDFIYLISDSISYSSVTGHIVTVLIVLLYIFSVISSFRFIKKENNKNDSLDLVKDDNNLDGNNSDKLSEKQD